QRTVLASTLSFSDEPPRSASPQAVEYIYRQSAGVIDPATPGVYRILVGPGDTEAGNMIAASVVLSAKALSFDERAPPIGYILIGVGFIGLVLASMSARRRPENPNSSPPPPRWGRS